MCAMGSAFLSATTGEEGLGFGCGIGGRRRDTFVRRIGVFLMDIEDCVRSTQKGFRFILLRELKNNSGVEVKPIRHRIIDSPSSR